jgi:transposase InsO family protein
MHQLRPQTRLLDLLNDPVPTAQGFHRYRRAALTVTQVLPNRTRPMLDPTLLNLACGDILSFCQRVALVTVKCDVLVHARLLSFLSCRHCNVTARSRAFIFSPSQTWRTFLDNHIGQIAAIDFFTVPTITFRLMYVFLVLRHDRRRVVHFNVTANPTAQWAARQIVEAFPFEEVPRFLLRDRDSIYGEYFRDRVKHMGIEEVPIAPQAPWRNPYAERIIGSIRRECLDHVIILNEDHLRRTLAEYFAYYHQARSHLSLERNSPTPRPVCPPAQGNVVATSYLGGLHHCYTRAA